MPAAPNDRGTLEMPQVPTGRTVRAGLYSLLAVPLAAILLVSWDASFIHTASGDDGTTYLLHHLWRHVRYGTDLFSPAGPWSIVYFPQYHPDTFWTMIAGQAAVAATLATILVGVATRHIRTISTGAVFIVGALGVFMLSQDARYFFLCLFALLSAPGRGEPLIRPLQLLALAGCALGFLIKGTFLIAAGIVVSFTFLHETTYLRRAPVGTALFLAALLILNEAAGQGLVDLFPYVMRGFDTAEGYTERYSELGSPIELVAFILAALPLGLAILACESRRSGAWGIATAFVYGIVLFLLFKTGFVRQDGQHVIRAFGGLLVFGTCYLAMRRDCIADLTGIRSHRMLSHRSAVIATSAALAIGLVGTWFFATRYPSLYLGKTDKLVSRIQAANGTIREGRQYFADGHQRALERVRRDHPLPALVGTVVAYSAIHTPAIAHSLDVSPLPSTAPGLSMSPASEDSNARMFESSQAPANILFQDTVFGIYRAGLSLLENYRLVGESGAFAVLQRSRKRTHTLTPVAPPTTAAWGEAIELPRTDSRLWSRIEYSPTLLNKALTLLYQPPPAYLVFLENGREVARVRATRSLLADGFIAAPAPAEPASFFRHPVPADRAIRLEVGESESWLFPAGLWQPYFRSEIRVSLFQLSLGDTPGR